jgi:hypothetical protein
MSLRVNTKFLAVLDQEFVYSFRYELQSFVALKVVGNKAERRDRNLFVYSISPKTLDLY